MARKPAGRGRVSIAQQMTKAMFGTAPISKGYPGFAGTPAGQPHVSSAAFQGNDARGLPIYIITIRHGNRPPRRMTVTWSGGKIGNVTRAPASPHQSNTRGHPSAPISGRAPQPTVQGNELQRRKDLWTSRLLHWDRQGMIAPGDLSAALATVRRAPDIDTLERAMGIIGQEIRDIEPWRDIVDRVFIEDDGGGGGGGGWGRGGGGGGPQYVEPDRRVVEDFVTGMLVSLIGEADDAFIQKFTDLYMKDHRRDFDTLDKEIDPSQSVLEAIRGTSEYKTIHRLRPEGEDERQWIAERRQIAKAAGVATHRIDAIGTQQATIGAAPEDARDAAVMHEFQATGAAPDFLENTFRQVAEGMMRGMVR